MAKQGVDQILKILDVVVQAGHFAETFSSKKSLMKKLMAAVPLAKICFRLLSLSIPNLIAESKDLDSDERLYIEEYLIRKFDLQDDALEETVEVGLSLVFDAVEYIERLMGYVKKLKKGDKK